MRPHLIRLAGPWEWQPLSETREACGTDEAQTCQLPFPSESIVESAHGILLRRRFHCPTGLDVTTRVAVVVETQNCIPELWLNDAMLTGVAETPAREGTNRSDSQPWKFDVSGLLKPYNELQVRLVARHSDPHLRLNAAAIEIREAG